MNIRKPINYNDMYMELDNAMKTDCSQMDLYCEIGKITSNRPEKGAAVAAAEYLQNSYTVATGFSPRNVRRMRDFYRTYESEPDLLDEAKKINWTQNVVILEAELSPTERAWYIRAVKHFNWSKLELMANIKECAHEILSLPVNSTSTEDQIRNGSSKPVTCPNLSGKKEITNHFHGLLDCNDDLNQSCCRCLNYQDYRKYPSGIFHSCRQTTALLLSSIFRLRLLVQKIQHIIFSTISFLVNIKCKFLMG